MSKFAKLATGVVCGVFGFIFFTYGMSVAFQQVMGLTEPISWAIVLGSWVVIGLILLFIFIDEVAV